MRTRWWRWKSILRTPGACTSSRGGRLRPSSRRGTITAKAWVTERVKPGVVFIPLHYMENAANRLTNAALDPLTKTPEYKVCAVQLDKLA